MNKRYIVMALAGFVWLATSCGGSKKEEAKSEDAYGEIETTEAPKPSADDVIAQGKTLMDAADCKTCHHPENKIIGPPHMEVAKKYEFTAANVKLLADKIKKGGSGVWGEIMMNAHPDLSDGDAEKMARYVLSLDGEKEH